MIPADTKTVHRASTVKDHGLCDAADVLTTKDPGLVNCPRCRELQAKSSATEKARK